MDSYQFETPIGTKETPCTFRIRFCHISHGVRYSPPTATHPATSPSSSSSRAHEWMNESLNRHWQPDKPACEGRGQDLAPLLLRWLLCCCCCCCRVAVAAVITRRLARPLVFVLTALCCGRCWCCRFHLSACEERSKSSFFHSAFPRCICRFVGCWVHGLLLRGWDVCLIIFACNCWQSSGAPAHD